MPLPHYERELEERAGRMFRRVFVIFFGVLALIGVVLGIAWTTVNLWQTHVGR
jgi:hypothetical protein